MYREHLFGSGSSNRVVWGALLLFSLSLVFWGCSQRTKGPVVAPHFELKNLEGKTVSSDSFKGKPTLLVFWATWCPTCKEELPTFNALQEKGVQVVAIALNESDDAVKEYVSEHGIRFPVLMTDQQVELDFGGIRFLPTAFLIDSNWEIVGKVFGKISTDEVVHAFEHLKKGQKE